MEIVRFSPPTGLIALMGKKQRILLAAFVVAVMGGVVWLFTPSPEPVYRDKTLGYWLDCYRSGSPSDGSAQADDAIRHMGTKAIPILLRLLQEPNSDLRDRVWGDLRQHHLVKKQFAPGHLSNLDAFYAFSALGALARNSVPSLISIFENDSTLFSQQAVPTILGKIGPAAETAIPLLVQRTTDTNAYVRANSIKALGQIHGHPQAVVPALIKSLNDPFVTARIEAARSLGAFGEDAQSAVPALLELRRREMLNAAKEPAFVVLPAGGYEPRAGPNGSGLSVVRKEMGWPVWPKDVITAATNALTQIDPKAGAK